MQLSDTPFQISLTLKILGFSAALILSGMELSIKLKASNAKC